MNDNFQLPEEDESSRVKLVFDVMPEGMSRNLPKAPTQAASRPSDQPTDSANTLPDLPVLNDVPSAPPAPPPSNSDAVSASHLTSSGISRFNFLKIGLIVVGVLVLGAAGYFGYRYWEDKQGRNAVGGDNAMTSNNLPPEWLKKHFGSETCDIKLCGPEVDADSDGLKNSKELQYNTSPRSADTDYDGLADGDEIDIYNTDPIVSDTDGDKFEDGVEVRNGYSPTASNSAPAGNLEKQVWQDNIDKSGLHEPSKTFLKMAFFRTKFGENSTTTPQLTLSVPFDWMPKLLPNSYIFSKPESQVFIDVVTMAQSSTTPETAEGARNMFLGLADGSVKSDQRKIESVQAYDDQYKIKGDGSASSTDTYIQRLTFQKSGQIFSVLFSAPNAEWSGLQKLAEIVINSVR